MKKLYHPPHMINAPVRMVRVLLEEERRLYEADVLYGDGELSPYRNVVRDIIEAWK